MEEYKNVIDQLRLLQEVERKTVDKIGKQLKDFICPDKENKRKLKYVGLIWYCEEFDRNLTSKRDKLGYACISKLESKSSNKYFNRLVNRYFVPLNDSFSWKEYGEYSKCFKDYNDLKNFYSHYKQEINEVLQESREIVEKYLNQKQML